MANEYGEIEQLVNDVTSLDTARMTLRWALERLNTIEKEKADLKKNLTIAEDTSKKLQLKDASLTEAYSSRAKSIEEKEDFYTKLEATMSLLGEGKLDIQQLLKKEAKLDGLRKSLEAEYSDKFEELDRNQRAVIERWNARLLEVESQYAGRLAEAQQKYDGLRAELESGYQGRLTSLQASLKSREQELNAKIGQLEGGVRFSEEKLEARRAELEKEHLLKQRGTEENYRKLKNMMEAGYEDKLRSMDGDHGAQVRSLEASWQTERNRIVDEQRVREEQFATAQTHIQEIENKLAAQQEKHHNELVKIITEKENAFRAQLAGLEKEKLLKEETVKQLVSRLEKQATDWEAERTRLENEFGRRLAGMDAAMRARAGELEQDYASKKEELANMLALSREEFDKEFKTRLAMERQAMAEEKARLSDEKSLREGALAANTRKVAELEQALAANHETHHKELMESIRTSESSFREKLSAFEAEKQAYNATINNLTVELRQREAGVLEEKRKIAAEFEAKSVIHSELLALTEASYEEKRRSYEGKISALAGRLDEAAKASAIEKENFQSEIARVSSETNAIAEERAAGIRADYEARKAELEKEFAARYSDRLKALEAEKARMTEALAEREHQMEVSYAKAAELDSVIAELRRSSSEEKAALSREYSSDMAHALKNAEENAKAREVELMTDVNVLREELTEKDRVLSAEREKLVDELSKASVDAHNRTEERASAIRAEYEQRLAAHATMSENSLAAIKNVLAEKEAQLEKAGEARLEAEHNLKAAFETEKVKWIEEKERQAADFELKVAEFDATLGERVANIRADYEGRKADLEKEFSGRYGDRLKALEAEKARMNEALTEREGQLTASYTKAAELDNAIAELRRSSTEEKAALAREYSSDMAHALKNAEENAKAREAELATDINVLRCEMEEKERVLSLQREQHAEELSKTAAEAHEKSEERAAYIRNDYEKRLADSMAIAESRIQELRGMLAEKEAVLKKAQDDGRQSESALKALFDQEKSKWVEEKENISAAFSRKAAELETGISARAQAIETEHAARRGRMEAEFVSRTEAVHAEVSAKIDFERGNWRSERSRFENLLAETAGNFKAAQKEIEAISAKLRFAVEEGAAREARFSKELMEAKANYDRELAYRVTDAVAVQTAHLMTALEAAKDGQKELAAALEEKEISIGALRSEAVETRRDYEERVRSAGSEAVAARRQELEQGYLTKKLELEREAAALREELQNAYQAREKELARQLEVKTARIEAENKALTASLEQLRAQAEAAGAKSADVFNKMMEASKKHQEELFQMKEENSSELDRNISGAVEAATKALANKLALAEGGLEKERADHKKEIEAREKFSEVSRKKMAAELDEARNYTEVQDFKIQDIEKELAKVRQTYAAEFLGRITEQDAQISDLEAKYKARQEKLEGEARKKLNELAAANEAKIRGMQEVVEAKEKLIQESEDFWGRKQAEVDKAHSDFNLRINRFNEELFEQKQALGERDKALNDYRLKLEKEYALKNAETENMKAELTKTIIAYKQRK